MTTSCEEPAIFFTSSMVSLHVEQPALKTSIFFLVFMEFSYFFSSSFRFTPGAHCHFAAVRPHIPERSNNKQPECSVHAGFGRPHKFAQKDSDGSNQSKEEWAVTVTLTRYERHRSQSESQKH